MSDGNNSAVPLLTDEQKDFFAEQGYLQLDALTDQEDVAAIRDIYDKLFSEQAGRDEGNEFDLAGTDEDGKSASLPQILDPGAYAPELYETKLFEQAEKLLKDLFGAESTRRFCHAIFKPAGHGAPTPWHQDAAYWSGNQAYPHSVSIWVPLQDVDEDNGCMQFVPGSHREEKVHRHQSINNDPRIHGLELHESEMYRTEDAVACPLRAGGCTVHGGYTLHYAGPNSSDVPRRALIIVGGLPPIKVENDEIHPWMAEKQTARNQRAAAARESD